MSELKVFARQIGLIGITNLILSLSGIILLPVITKNIPIVDYGTWVQINITIGLIPSIIMLGLPYSMVRYLAAEKNKEKIQEGFYSILVIIALLSIVLSLVIYILSVPISKYLFNGNILITQILCVIIFIECINNLLFSFLRTYQYIIIYSIFQIMKIFVNLGLVAYFIYNGYGIVGATLAILITDIVIFAIIPIFIILKIGIKIPRFENVMEYLRFGIPTLPSNLSGWVVDSSDRYVIGIFLGTAFVGYYSPGYTLGNALSMFIAPFAFILPAILSKYYDENNTSVLDKIYKYSLKYYLLIAIPSMFGLALMSKAILNILSTTEIAEHGYLITPIVALSALIVGIYVIFVQIIILEKKTPITGAIWIIAAIVNLGLNVILVPNIGIIGAAITTLIANIIAFALTIYYSRKYYQIHVDFSYIIKSLLSSGVISVIIIFVNPTGITDLLITVCACAIVYFVLLIALKVFKKEEIYFLKDLVKV